MDASRPASKRKVSSRANSDNTSSDLAEHYIKVSYHADIARVKGHFARIFNDHPHVVNLTAQVMPYAALFQVADGLHGSCSGFLRATEKLNVGAAINVISYYCSALPLGIWLSRHGLGLVVCGSDNVLRSTRRG